MRQDAVDQLMVIEVCTHLLPVEHKMLVSLGVDMISHQRAAQRGAATQSAQNAIWFSPFRD
jgi:hypothetical protein